MDCGFHIAFIAIALIVMSDASRGNALTNKSEDTGLKEAVEADELRKINAFKNLNKASGLPSWNAQTSKAEDAGLKDEVETDKLRKISAYKNDNKARFSDHLIVTGELPNNSAARKDQTRQLNQQLQQEGGKKLKQNAAKSGPGGSIRRIRRRPCNYKTKCRRYCKRYYPCKKCKKCEKCEKCEKPKPCPEQTPCPEPKKRRWNPFRKEEKEKKREDAKNEITQQATGDVVQNAAEACQSLSPGKEIAMSLVTATITTAVATPIEVGIEQALDKGEEDCEEEEDEKEEEKEEEDGEKGEEGEEREGGEEDGKKQLRQLNPQRQQDLKPMLAKTIREMLETSLTKEGAECKNVSEAFAAALTTATEAAMKAVMGATAGNQGYKSQI